MRKEEKSRGAKPRGFLFLRLVLPPGGDAAPDVALGLVHLQHVIMAIPSLLLALVSLGAYVLYKVWESSRRNRIPTGLKPLPGPKGKTNTLNPMHLHLLD